MVVVVVLVEVVVVDEDVDVEVDVVSLSGEIDAPSEVHPATKKAAPISATGDRFTARQATRRFGQDPALVSANPSAGQSLRLRSNKVKYQRGEGAVEVSASCR